MTASSCAPCRGDDPRRRVRPSFVTWLQSAGMCAALVWGSACSKSTEETPPNDATEAGSENLDGAALFRIHCAACHGERGDGDGVVQFDRKARSFVEGAFSFGNTPEALTRTVAHGIGGTQMIGFGSILSEPQIEAVVQHVISLGPERESSPSEEQTRMTVGERALVVRGGLPPIAEGQASVARGLLVGNADGLSLQYATQPFRLLGVRQGLFVDRKDWQSRGGDVLQPLGQLVYRFGAHAESGEVPIEAEWVRRGPSAAEEPGAWVSVPATFAGTAIEGPTGWVEYELLVPEAGGSLRVRESFAALSLGGWSGFRRTVQCSAWSDDWGLQWADDAATQWTGPPVPRANMIAGRDRYLWMRYRPHGKHSLVRVSHPPKEIEGGQIERVEDYLFGLSPEPPAFEALWEAYL